MIDAEEQNAFSESVTFEAKEKKDRNNVADAVAALSNTDGGIVLVGVKDKDAVGEDRIVGVPKAEHDALAGSLHLQTQTPLQLSVLRREFFQPDLQHRHQHSQLVIRRRPSGLLHTKIIPNQDRPRHTSTRTRSIRTDLMPADSLECCGRYG